VINIFSTARSRILAELKNRPYTASELSKITGYSKGTVFYHLEKLNKAGYVKRVERGKWVYYSLTHNGINALRYEIAKMAVLFVGGVISLAYGALLILTKKPKFVGYVKEVERAPIPKPTPFKAVEFAEYYPYLFIAVGLVFVVTFLILKFRYVPLKSKGG